MGVDAVMAVGCRIAALYSAIVLEVILDAVQR